MCKKTVDDTVIVLPTAEERLESVWAEHKIVIQQNG